MSSRPGLGLRDAVSRNLSLILPLVIVGAVLVLVAPLPPLVLDVLLAANITLAVVILLTSLHVSNPLDFSVFPTVLLITTLLRLVLNVASTRLILSGAAERGTHAAGAVVASFGEFVAAGSLTVGVILFVILVAVQFLVITKGASRIGEVAARFALDGMPGRQMAVDADLAAGLITQQDAQARRREITQQADFYGAMDGASRFVRGDALAGLLITAVNIVGGLLVGVGQQGMSFSQAAAVFTTLTIGDGLVSQIPAFLISVAAGLIVTRTSLNSDLPREAVSQVFGHPVAMYIAAGVLACMAFTGLPTAPLLTLSLGCAVIGWFLSVRPQEPEPSPESVSEPPPSQPAAPRLHVEPLELELGVSLLKFADPTTGGDLLQRVTKLRQQIAEELGFLLPKMHIRDNLRLDPRSFRIKLRGVPVVTGEAYADALLAVETAEASPAVSGIETVEPGSSRRALWIEPAERTVARAHGYRLRAPQEFVIDTLAVVVRRHASELLTRQHVHELLQDLGSRSPGLVAEVQRSPLSAARIHQVLANLLQEGVPIRDLESVLETLGNLAEEQFDVEGATEHVRRALARAVCGAACDEEGVLHAVRLSGAAEADLLQELSRGAPDRVADEISRQLVARTSRLIDAGCTPVVLCRSALRRAVRDLAERACPGVKVLSTVELVPGVEVAVHGDVIIRAVAPPAADDNTNAFERARSRVAVPV